MAELMDWWAYYLFLNDRDDEGSPASDKDKMEFLNQMKQKCGS